MAEGMPLPGWVARDGSELLGWWVAAGSRRDAVAGGGVALSFRECWLPLGPGRGRRDGGGDAAAVVGCQGEHRGHWGCWVRGRRAGLRRRPYGRGPGTRGWRWEEGERVEGRGVREDGDEEEEGGHKGRPYSGWDVWIRG